MIEFMQWWLVTHWIWATIFTPGLTFLYALFTGQFWWMFWPAVLYGMTSAGKAGLWE